MFKHFCLCVWAFQIVWAQVEISHSDRLRLWIKSLALYLSFLAFTDRERPKVQLKRAMISAVLSALYDYDTDWVRTSDPASSMFYQQVDVLLADHPAREESSTTVKNLFQMDWEGKFSADGLERGGVALRSYRKII